MAEQLADYLDENGARVRYLHSEVGTVERVEIIHDLRRGEFDILVGINLLREGLDLPEGVAGGRAGRRQGGLSALGVLADPDHRPRAARHINGRAILYADEITGSIERAIAETQRRRALQMDHNRRHGITPRAGCASASPRCSTWGESAKGQKSGRARPSRAPATRTRSGEPKGVSERERLDALDSPAAYRQVLETLEARMHECAPQSGVREGRRNPR